MDRSVLLVVKTFALSGPEKPDSYSQINVDQDLISRCTEMSRLMLEHGLSNASVTYPVHMWGGDGDSEIESLDFWCIQGSHFFFSEFHKDPAHNVETAPISLATLKAICAAEPNPDFSFIKGVAYFPVAYTERMHSAFEKS